ncbi:serine--tRNA ligase [Candidatus Nanosalina sp. VS9-1]|uniref:serine--tRNA ligase n=1 Tax=Candidatus Nanosalina sp. VS9-1 TaxID=3388566 RepID=UPI0039E1E6CE
MLDIELFRESPEIIKASEERRGKDPERVDKVVELDEAWRETLQRLQELQEKRNSVGDKIAELKKNGEDAQEYIEKMQEVKETISELEEDVEALKAERDELRYRVGNVLHDSVPEGDDEDDNREIKTWEPDSGIDEDAELAADILQENDLVETEKAAELSGERAYYLKNELFRLNQALIQFSMDLLEEKDFTPMQTPYYLKHRPMEAAAELEDFEEQLYKIEDEDKYLIATSEQTLATFHMDEILQPQDLPKKYAGFSTNFRQEAGKHGQETRGIWRVHQFEKVEQYIFCEPEESWDKHEELLENSEEVMQKLGLPYRVVNVCTGDMNDNAAKKYDVEVWRPPLQEYGEVVSCSNCTDFQARKVGVRIRRDGDNETAHTLNATACATSRVMTAIIENNQTEQGIKIPEPLQKYMGGKEFIELE